MGSGKKIFEGGIFGRFNKLGFVSGEVGNFVGHFASIDTV